MSTTQHPLTDAAIAEMWESGSTNPWSFRGMHLEEQDATLHAMRAAFDAGREHERQDSDLGRATVAPGATKADAPLREGEVREQIVTNDIGEWVNVETRANGYGFLHLGCGHMMNLDRETRAALSAALAADARPWEPLNEGPVRVGDEVRQELRGGTTIAVVGRVDVEGDPWTDEDRFIGVLDEGTWYVRRADQELPTEDGAVIVPADGSEFIEQVGDCANYRRLTYDAASGRWIGWDMLNHEAEALSPEYITPGTWKVDGE